ncbi:unnamed protein product [Heterobilharzia americana]|nr:unnamed protein product [Heterobilharzia americana]
MDDVPCCYCAYEVPFRGVSSENPTGHLLTAIRNSGEKQLFGKPLDTVYRYGCFEVSHNKLALYGILGLSNWEILFVPCLNLSQVNNEEINSIRQLLSRTLTRTEPYFYRSWASDRPGCIGLGKIDCLLLQDKHDRMYKFDPIINSWIRTMDGLKLNFTKRWLFESKQLPHLPTRILVLTTDFEVYSFQIYYTTRSSTISLLTSYELHTLQKNMKQNVRLFINLLTSRISYIRRSSGFSLTDEYANRDLQTISIVDQQSRNLDSLYEFIHGSPNNFTPVNPLTRLKAKWYHRLKGDYELIDNTDFAYCRTLPLEIPTLAFKTSVIIFRDYFEGHRFPVLSFYYSHDNNAESHINSTSSPLSYSSLSSSSKHFGVWILRSGNLLTDMNVNQLIHCNYTSINNSHDHQHKLFIKHIKLSYAGNFSELKQITKSSKFNEQKSQLYSRELYTPLLLNDECSYSSNYVDNSNELLSNQYDHEDNDECIISSFEENVSIPSSLIQQQQVDWCIPKRSHIQQSWLQLKNLIHLSQIHTPDVEILSEFSNNNNNNAAGNSSPVTLDHHLSNSSNNNNNNNNNDNSSNNSTVYMNWDTLSTDSLGSEQEQKISDNIIFRRKLKGSDQYSSVDKRYSTRSEIHKSGFFYSNSSNNNSIGSNISKSFGRSYSRFNLLNKMKLDNMAFQCSPHRSDWSSNLLSTNWLDLLSFTLKQATELTSLIHQYSIKPVDGYNGTIILLSGPDSGRNWQPILMSLIQIMLSSENRTMHGFEDLIEQEWIRYGYPFVPDPTDWYDNSITPDYDNGVCFALFLDCVHQLLIQFPTEFAFTQDYLVLLLDSGLSRGGGIPPFTVEFSCSCEAARCVKTKALTHEQITEKSNFLHSKGAWRSFRNWNDVLNMTGLQLLPNWLYWWQYSYDPMQMQPNSSDYIELIKNVKKSTSILIPNLLPIHYPRFWLHAWYRWNRSIRLTNGGGYAFDAAYYRDLLNLVYKSNYHKSLLPRTSSSPYTGWLSDESIINALNNQTNFSMLSDPIYKSLYDVAILWDSEFCDTS